MNFFIGNKLRKRQIYYLLNVYYYHLYQISLLDVRCLKPQISNNESDISSFVSA
jgi:hypothetical protein